MKGTYNEQTVTLKLKRIELCDLILATTLIKQRSNATKWETLREKLKEILTDFDEKHFENFEN
jgi:hypothetical protein